MKVKLLLAATALVIGIWSLFGMQIVNSDLGCMAFHFGDRAFCDKQAAIISQYEKQLAEIEMKQANK